MTALPTALSQQDAGDVSLYLTQGTHLKNTTLETIEYLTGQDYHVITIAVTLPYAIAKRSLLQKNVDMSRIHYIDTLTKYSLGPHIPEAPQCIFLSSPADLTNLGIAITETLHRVPEGKRCVILDDISTLLLYSPSDTVLKFLHFMVTKLRLQDVDGILFSVDKVLAPQILAQMQILMDTIVVLDSPDTKGKGAVATGS